MGTGMKRKIADELNRKTLLRRWYRLYQAGWAAATSRYPVGTNVYEREWDALVLLDTCRLDALREVAPEYDFLDGGAISAITSRGSTSVEWIANTFTTDYLNDVQRTACVSANADMETVLVEQDYPYEGFSCGRLLDWHPVTPSDFGLLDQPWKYVPDEDKPFRHTPATFVTDRAIAVGREYDPDRLLVHYSQPHHPYTAIAEREGRGLDRHEELPIDYLRDGGSRERVWNAYLANLRSVLDAVAVLLDNLDAERVIVSADHGEAFGEFGMYYHRFGMLHPSMRRVPWAVTAATDTGAYTPTLEPPEGPPGPRRCRR